MSSDGVVTTTARCVSCSYELRGLPVDGRCPECGTPVADSLRPNLLVNSAPEYVGEIHKGVFLIELAIGIALVVVIGAILTCLSGALITPAGRGSWRLWFGGTGAPWMEIVWSVVWIVISLLGFVGWWKFSTPDPRAVESDRGEQPRRTVRGAVVAQLIMTILAGIGGVWVSTNAASGTGGTGATAAAVSAMALPMRVSVLVAFAVQYFAAMLYIAWMAPRFPDEHLRRHARTMMWLGPALVTAGCACLGLGPLIACILYFNLLENVRVDLKTVRRLVSRQGARDVQNMWGDA